jgi:hypothetical protein
MMSRLWNLVRRFVNSVTLRSRLLLPEENPMTIGFRVKTDNELCAEFAALNDTQLIETGKMLAQFAKPRPGHGPDENWLRQLRIAREVWRERHPRGDVSV